MIDYITIMRKVILFINSSATPEKINKYIDELKLSKTQKLLFTIANHIEIITVTALLSFIIIMCILIYPPAIIAIITTVIFSILVLVSMIHIFDFKKQIIDNAIQKCELDAASTLPDGNISLDDIMSFNKYRYGEAVPYIKCTMPDLFPVDKEYEKGNLYDLPITKLLEIVNVKSTKNLLSNIRYLNNYYKDNYVNDNRYNWVNKQLNEFYNPTEPHTNNDILKDLKN